MSSLSRGMLPGLVTKNGKCKAVAATRSFAAYIGLGCVPARSWLVHSTRPRVECRPALEYGVYRNYKAVAATRSFTAHIGIG